MRKRGERQRSNIYSCLTQGQMRELRQTFDILDTDKDGLLSKSDLTEFLDTMGSPYSEAEIDEMMEELGPNSPFLSFLTLITDNLSRIDETDVILKAFKDFSINGKIKESELREWLDIPDADFEILVKGCVTNDLVDFAKLTSIMKHGEVVDK